MDDLRDQVERVLGAQPEPDQGDIGTLPRRHRADLSDVDLARDHLVAETGHDRGEQLEPVSPLVRDQDAKVLGRSVGHTASKSRPTGLAFSDPCYYR